MCPHELTWNKMKSRSIGNMATRFKTVRIAALMIVCLSLFACVTSPPKKMDNVCSIFKEKRSWYKAAKKSQKKWGSPIPTLMAFIHQESRFEAKAKPPRKKILWIFPGPRLSSSYGYSQAKDSTWDWYKRDSGARGADRDNFGDAVDFIGWYNAQSRKRNGIALNDSHSLYLAFHEGHGGYSKKTYQSKDWLRSVAAKVSSRSNRYASQLSQCEKELNRSRWWPF